jgi:hypothetical protein
MKRMACPACGKPMLVPDGKAEKRFPCPTCKKHLVLADSGLSIVVESSRQPSVNLVRPDPPMVPLTAPVPESTTAPAEPPRPATPAPPLLPQKKQSSWWFVPVAGAFGLLAAIASLVAMFVFLPFRSPLKDEEEPGGSPRIVIPLDPSGRQNGKQRVWPTPHDRLVNGQSQVSAIKALPMDRGTATAAVPKPAPSDNTVRPVAPPAGGDSDDPIQRVLRSVALVAARDAGHGSGFVVAPGVLVTNYHVIEDAVIRDVEITFPDNETMAKRPLRAELVHMSIPDDLAFLAIDSDVPPLEIKAEYEHVNGQRVVAVGSPGTGGDGPKLENLTTDGRLGPELMLDGDCKRWSLSMAVNGGNSGGPLVDAQTGGVIGVIVAKFTKTEAQSLAIPHAALVRELARAKQASEDSRATLLSLHRQRYCLRRMFDILGVTSFAFDRSIAAAIANSEGGGAAMNAAFNECKATTAAVLAKRFAEFSGNVGGEVEDLQDDPYCDVRIRRGLRKLMRDIEEQADDIRRTVPREEIAAFLGRFRGSVQGSRALVVSLAERLQFETDEEE